MARQPILLGTSPTGAGGDTARQAFNKVNEMTDELYQSVGGLEEGATATGERLDALETFRGTAEPAITSLQTNLSAAETAISALQASREFNLTPGANITIDRTDPENPVISATGGGGGEGTVTSVAGVGPDGTGNVPSAELIPALGIDQKVDVEAGKGLSTNDFTDAEQTKLAGIEVGAQVNVGTALSQGVRTDTTVTVGSSTGDGAVLDAASPTEAGVMSAADKAKLNGVAAGATANASTDELTEGSANKYFNENRVLATLMAGFTLIAGGTVSAADSLLVAVGKLQKQINDLFTGKQDTLVSATNIKTVNGNSLLGSGDLAIEGASAELGATEFFTGNRATLATARPGRIPIDGGLLSRTTYADFWAFVQANYTVVSDADWLNASLGLYGHFSSGDGSTTFRMPDWNGAVGGHKRRVPRGTPGDGSGLTEDALQNITGSWGDTILRGGLAGTGAFVTDGPTVSNGVGGGASAGRGFTFDASRVARTADETRAASIDGIWLMRAASGGSNPGTVDITALASEQVAQGARITTLEGNQVFTEEYVSTPQAITTAGRLTLPHGLTGIPKKCYLELHCLTADQGFAVGTIIELSEFIAYSTTAASRNVIFMKDATNVVVQYGATNPPFICMNNSTNSLISLANASWAAVVRAIR